MERRSRYPGTRPFSDSEEDRRLFFGRSQETERLFLRVLSVDLLVLFGRSGLGKTSLLRAGLFPRLRSKEYLPVTVRLNTPGEPVGTTVARAIDRACEAEGLDPPKVAAADLPMVLAKTIVWRKDVLLTPVLVLDQFEEVFTLHDPGFRTQVANEIGALVFRRGNAGESGTRASFPFKLIISLREDFLGALEEMTAQVPNLFHERIRVQPFGEAAAREAITGPAAVEDVSGAPFTVAPFAYAPELLDEILGYLRGSFGVIEPFQLQLLCRRAEEAAERLQRSAAGPVRLVPGSFGSEFRYEQVLRDFYRDVLSELPRAQRLRAARLCEEGLLDRSGHRLMLEATQIESEYRVRPATLTWLTEERVLLREQRRESVFYEIGHDRLAESIAQNRRFRIPRRYRRALWTGAVVVPLLLGALFSRTTQIAAEKQRAEQALTNSEQLLRFLVSEDFLTTIADVGGSATLAQVRDAANAYLALGQDIESIVRARILTSVGDLEMLAGHSTKGIEAYEKALKALGLKQNPVEAAREAGRIRTRLGSALLLQGRTLVARSTFESAIRDWQKVIRDGGGESRDCLGFARTRVAQAEGQRRLGDVEAALDSLTSAVHMALETMIVEPPDRQWCPGAPPGAGRIPPQIDADALEVVSRAVLTRAHLLDQPDEYYGAFQLASEVRRLKPLSPSARRNAVTAQAWWLLRAPEGEGRRRLFDYFRLLRELERLQRWDPENRSLLRQRGEVTLLATQAALHCKATKACDPPPSIQEAESLNLQALAIFRWLQGLDEKNSVAMGDVGWALLDRARLLEVSRQASARQDGLQALRQAEQQWAKAPFDGDVERDVRLAEVRVTLAEAEAEAGHVEKAQELLVRTLNRLGPLVTKTKNPACPRVLAQAHSVGARFRLQTPSGDLVQWSEDESHRLEARASRLSGEILEGSGKSVSMPDLRARIGGLGALAPAAEAQQARALESELIARIAAYPSEARLYDLMRRVHEANAEASLRARKESGSPDQAVNAAIHEGQAWNAALRSSQLAALLSKGEEEEKVQLRREMRRVGDHLADTGRPEESLPFLREEVSMASELVEPRIEPTPRTEDAELRPEALRVLADSLFRFAKALEATNKSGAEEVLQRALVTARWATELDGKNAEGWTLVGRIELARGERPGESRVHECRAAREALDKALKLNGANTSVQALLTRAEGCMGAGHP
jgi:tetratricopeptide (TPR) repeat protein